MNITSFCLLVFLSVDQPDTSIIQKSFDTLKSKGTAERVILLNNGTSTTYFRRKFDLISYNIETTSTGNKVIPYFAVVKFRARVKTSKDCATMLLATNALLENNSESFLQWQAIYRLVQDNWALENIVYRSTNGEISGDYKTTMDARHFVYDWFNALDGY